MTKTAREDEIQLFLDPKVHDCFKMYSHDAQQVFCFIPIITILSIYM